MRNMKLNFPKPVAAIAVSKSDGGGAVSGIKACNNFDDAIRNLELCIHGPLPMSLNLVYYHERFLSFFSLCSAI